VARALIQTFSGMRCATAFFMPNAPGNLLSVTMAA